MPADERAINIERFVHVEGRVSRLSDDVKEIKGALNDRVERFALIEGRLVRIEDDVKEIVIALNGPPRQESVKGRLHELEQSKVAARAAEAALRMAQELHDRRLSKTEKVAAISFGCVFAASSVITTVIVVAQQLS